jgi:hypothetical protein
MGSPRTTAQLAIDFPVDNFNLPKTIRIVDRMAQNGDGLAGVALSQVLDSIGAAIDALSESVAAPTAAFTGTAGSTSYKYAVVREHPIPQSVPGAPTSSTIPGIPLSGRGPLQAARTVRYSAVGAVVTVADCAATLDAANYVTITAPSLGSTDANATYAVVKVGAAVAATGKFYLVGYVDDATYAVTVDGDAASVTSADGALATATALAAAIETATSNAVTAVASEEGDVVVILVTAATAGTAGNAIGLSVTSPSQFDTNDNDQPQFEEGAEPNYMFASGEFLTGGSTGDIIAVIATGVAPGGTAIDNGSPVNAAALAADPITLPSPHSEYGNIPTRPAKVGILVGGTFEAGQVLSATVGTAAQATDTAATSLAATATAFAAAIAAASGAVVTASAAEVGSTGTYLITLTSTATGAAGNGVPVITNAGTGTITLAVVPVQTGATGAATGNSLQGGITAAPVLSPRTLASVPSGN